MNNPQGGIFALGTASHAYFEFSLRDNSSGAELVRAISGCASRGRRWAASISSARVQAGALAEVSGGELPTSLGGFDEDLVGIDGFVMPATQHDAVLWLSGSAYDVIFDVARAAIASSESWQRVAEETSSWPYRHDRDLTGFIDGSENPDADRCAGARPRPRGTSRARAGRSCSCRSGLTTPPAWEALPDAEQERVIGRTKPDSVELEDQARRLARREHRPGPLRQDLPPQHALTARSPTTGRCSSASAPSSSRSSAMLESMAGLG